MTQDQINMFMMAKGECFESSEFMAIKDMLEKLPEEATAAVLGAEFKNPTTALLISFLGGQLGIDRFYVGNTGKGIVKLLTCGGAGIWTIIDLFLIRGAARESNLQKFVELTSAFKIG